MWETKRTLLRHFLSALTFELYYYNFEAVTEYGKGMPDLFTIVPHFIGQLCLIENFELKSFVEEYISVDIDVRKLLC